LLADDHTVVRQGLRALLSAEPDIEVVGEADNGRQTVQMARRLLSNVVVMDIAMPHLNGLEATRQIVREGLPCKVLILTSYGDDEYVHQLTEAGASGYLIKQTASTDLIKAIRETCRGNAFFSPSISKRLLDYYREAYIKGRPIRRRSEQLTSRELEILQLVAEGGVNKEIASSLSISVKTVEKHRQQLMNKLNIHDVAGLTRYAISRGVIESHARFEAQSVASDAPNEGPAPAEVLMPATVPTPVDAPAAVSLAAAALPSALAPSALVPSSPLPREISVAVSA
jgi:DNA-binding NarL/FixJ family response regulator